MQTTYNETPRNAMKRNTFVTIWLWILIVYYCITIFFGNSLPHFTTISWLLSFLNIGFVYLLFIGKKNGFWGLCVSAVIGMFVSFSSYSSHSTILILQTCIGIGVNYAIFQLKENGVSFWSQLENTKIDSDIKDILAKWRK